jgi:HPt (histidine-containing phosphotransfer) domain-containing protein
LSGHNKKDSEVAPSVLAIRQAKRAKRAEQRLRERAEREARLLTPAQQVLVARAREDIARLSRGIAGAETAGNQLVLEGLLARRKEVADMLAAVLRGAEEAAAGEMARLMTTPPRGAHQGSIR